MEDLLLSYLTKYYEEHHTINDISRDTVVEYEGKTLKVGELLSSIRKQYRLYLRGDKSRGCAQGCLYPIIPRRVFRNINLIRFTPIPFIVSANIITVPQPCFFRREFYRHRHGIRSIPLICGNTNGATAGCRQWLHPQQFLHSLRPHQAIIPLLYPFTFNIDGDFGMQHIIRRVNYTRATHFVMLALVNDIAAQVILLALAVNGKGQLFFPLGPILASLKKRLRKLSMATRAQHLRHHEAEQQAV